MYGNSFSSDLGRCFRWIYELETTRPMRCPGSVQTRGWWQDGANRFWLVDACTKHADVLRPQRPAGAKPGLPGPTQLRGRGKRSNGFRPEATVRAA